MDWGTVAVAVVASLLSSSVISAVISSRGSQQQAREQRHTSNVDGARDALAELRTAYYEQGDVDQHELVRLENAFDAAIGKCDSEAVLQAARDYKDVGRAWCAMDPDVSKETEERSYEALQSAMNRRTRRFRPR